MRLRRLKRSELPGDTEALARWLIGRIVVRVLPDGRIVETEAYIQGDAAGHAFRGMTARNGSLFLRPGHAYVYRAYGTAWMLNVSSEPAGIGAGVLIRALEPLSGMEHMRHARGNMPDRDLARGPGRLAEALSIDCSLDGIDLTAPGMLWLATDDEAQGETGISTRIGITRDAHRPLRFYQRGSSFVSGPRRLNA